MKSARDQDVATGVISLGLLANKLAWYLLGGNEELPALKVDKDIFEQWQSVLKETISFIQSPETGKTRQRGAIPHFLSRAQYLEQIYSAAPIENKDTKALSQYLEAILKSVENLDKGKKLNTTDQEKLLVFSASITKHSIEEAAKFHQEGHVRENSESKVGITAGA